MSETATNPVMVEATAPGFYADYYRQRGDAFELKRPQDYSPKWMRFVEIGNTIPSEFRKAAQATAARFATNARIGPLMLDRPQYLMDAPKLRRLQGR